MAQRVNVSGYTDAYNAQRDRTLRNRLMQQQELRAQQAAETDALNARAYGQSLDMQAQRFTTEQEALTQQQQAQQKQQKLNQTYAGAAWVLQAPPGQKRARAKYAFGAIAPELSQRGIDLEALDDAQVDELAMNLQSEAGAALGKEPAAKPVPFAQSAEAEKLRMQQENAMELERVRQQGVAAAAERKTDAGPSMRDVTSLRKEFESTDAAKNYRAVLPLYNRAKTAPNSRAGDISLIYALGKMFDPTSVVREGELVLAQNAAPWLVKMASQANSQLTADGQLNPQTRAMIMEALKGQVDSFRIPYDQERERYSQYATEYGIDPFKVVGKDAAEAFDVPSGTRDARIPNGVAIRNTSKSGRPIISRDGGTTWEYE